MMAACAASQNGKRVLLLEKNKDLGEKLRISGGGRCNITNAEYDVRAMLKKYGESEQLLYSAFSQFGVQETFSFFEDKNLPLIVENNKRAFPASQKASDVVHVFEQCMRACKVTIKRSTPITSIQRKGNSIIGVIAGTRTYAASSYILATGGVSHPETGSTGDGFAWLQELGHHIVTPSPHIVPLAAKETWVHALAGKSLPLMKITFFVNGSKRFSAKGPLLFTHFGISGPTVLNASGRVADLLEEGAVTAHVDCFPDMNEGELDAMILREFDAQKNKTFRNTFRLLVPPGLGGLLTCLSSIDPEKKVHSISKDERKDIVKTLKSLSLTISGLMGFDRAVVADGGVPLEEMDMKTMRSKVLENLFIIGDLLHITRPSGGYSLQLCWTTGCIAGRNA